MKKTLIRNSTVYDGTGCKPFHACVAFVVSKGYGIQSHKVHQCHFYLTAEESEEC